MSKIKSCGRYVIRIYKMKYCFDNYDDNIYRVSDRDVNPDDVRITRYADDQQELLRVWKELLKKYEGYTYAIWDTKQDCIITGGVFDPSDDDWINDYF